MSVEQQKSSSKQESEDHAAQSRYDVLNALVPSEGLRRDSGSEEGEMLEQKVLLPTEDNSQSISNRPVVTNFTARGQNIVFSPGYTQSSPLDFDLPM